MTAKAKTKKATKRPAPRKRGRNVALVPGKTRGPYKFDLDAQRRAVEAWADLGRQSVAAGAAGVSVFTIKNYIRYDPDFAEAWEEARMVYRDKIQAEVYRRGVVGYLKPIVSTLRRRTEDGVEIVKEIVGHETVLSDRMLELEAKRVVPEYRDRQEPAVQVNTGVLVVGRRPETEEEWVEKHGGERELPPLPAKPG